MVLEVCCASEFSRCFLDMFRELVQSMPTSSAAARVVRLGEQLMTLDSPLVDGGGVQVDRCTCCLRTV